MSEQSRDWRELCRAIIAEQDTSRLLELVTELNRVLEEKKPSESLPGDDETDEDKAV